MARIREGCASKGFRVVAGSAVESPHLAGPLGQDSEHSLLLQGGPRLHVITRSGDDVRIDARPCRHCWPTRISSAMQRRCTAGERR